MIHRPKYHFVPERNWMNDPNATIYFKGEHHLFYQHNPDDWHWGNLHYGHAVSRDLLHWKHMPVALAPAFDRGETHCYSGCSYINNGQIELLYTSVGAGERCQNSGSQQWAATTEDGISWHQIKENPVMTNDMGPDGVLTEWRDPFVFHWKGKTYALVAGIVKEQYSAVHIYETEDYRNWRYVNEFFRNACAKEVIECPNIVVYGDRVLFLYSIWNVRVLHWFVGTISEELKLIAYNEGCVDYGDFFASQISFDGQGRTLMWGWLREDPRRGLLTDGEWAGVQAIPRVISITEDNRFLQERLPEFETIRRTEEKIELKDFTGRKYAQTESVSAEITAAVYSEHVFSVRLLEDEESEEYTDIIFNPREGTYYAPMEESSLLDSVDKRPILGYFPRSGDGAVHIDILLDSSVAEIYINKESCMTLRVYPMKEGKRISIASEKGVERAEVSVYEVEL